MKNKLKNLGLNKSTIDVYMSIYKDIDKQDPIGWFEKQISMRQPIGTLLPKRAILKHFLIKEKGISPEKVDILIPKMKGLKGKQRQGLTKVQLKEYRRLADVVCEPSRTILLLLPITGMRISEICNLKYNNLIEIGDRYIFKFIGKGDKERIVPLSLKAQRILISFINEYPNKEFIFQSNKGRPITPRAVRKHTKKIKEKSKTINELSPHILRHTFATTMDSNGVSMKRLQKLLGHSNITTTSRYLHPTTEDLLQAIDTMDKEN
jgi:site-specific recombinase XerD